MNRKIAFGGGCHWCTEAVFLSLNGVEKVEQGYVASVGKNNEMSEAVIVHFHDTEISSAVLIEIHLHTHKSTSSHSMRAKYRSAIYTFNEEQNAETVNILNTLRPKFMNKLITEVLPFVEFKSSREQLLNYYYQNPNKPFCENFINPKLKFLLKRYAKQVNQNKLKHLKEDEKY